MSRYIILRNKRETFSFQVEKKSVLIISLLIFLTISACMIGLSVGNTMIHPLEVIYTLFGQGSGEYDFIIMALRFPRVMVGLLVGAALGVSGAILQGIIRNPLASPDIIGITNGGAVAAVAFITFLAGTVSIKWLPLASIIGAGIAALLIYFLSWKKGVSPLRLVLVGIGLHAALGAATKLMLVLSPIYTAGQAYIWLTGSIYGSSWQSVYILLPWVLVFLALALYLARTINLQELGDDIAQGLGASVQRQRFALLFISVGLAGAAVSIGGAISFVALIAPHIARKLVGRSMGILIPVAALTGGLIVFIADFIARTAFYPLDIPAGVFTAGVGAPFFIYLLFKNRNNF